MLSNELLQRPAGQGCLAALMDVKGHLQALVRALVTDDSVLLEMPAERLAPVEATLLHYKVAAPVRFAQRPVAVLGLVGPHAAELLAGLGAEVSALGPEAHTGATLPGGEARVARASDLPGRLRAAGPARGARGALGRPAGRPARGRWAARRSTRCASSRACPGTAATWTSRTCCTRPAWWRCATRPARAATWARRSSRAWRPAAATSTGPCGACASRPRCGRRGAARRRRGGGTRHHRGRLAAAGADRAGLRAPQPLCAPARASTRPASRPPSRRCPSKADGVIRPRFAAPLADEQADCARPRGPGARPGGRPAYGDVDELNSVQARRPRARRATSPPPGSTRRCWRRRTPLLERPDGPARAPASSARLGVVVVPTLFWREHPEIGGDGQLMLDVARGWASPPRARPLRLPPGRARRGRGAPAGAPRGRAERRWRWSASARAAST